MIRLSVQNYQGLEFLVNHCCSYQALSSMHRRTAKNSKITNLTYPRQGSRDNHPYSQDTMKFYYYFDSIPPMFDQIKFAHISYKLPLNVQRTHSDRQIYSATLANKLTSIAIFCSTHEIRLTDQLTFHSNVRVTLLHLY